MKKGLALLSLALVLLLAGCKKETSIEKSDARPDDNTWIFTEGTSEFKGTFNLVEETDIQSFQVLQMQGLTANGNEQIALQVAGPLLQVGEYYPPLAIFFYVQDGDAIYQSPASTTDFKITVTEVTERHVSGTFAGDVLTPDGSTVLITNGRFSALR